MTDTHNVLEQAIERLTAHIGRGCQASELHYVDQAHAKLLFKQLYLRGVPLDRAIVQMLANAQGWHERSAKQLGEWAEMIGKGGPVRVKHKTDWAEGVVNELMS